MRAWRAPRFKKMKPPMLAQVAIDFPGAQVRMNFNCTCGTGRTLRMVVCGSRGTLRSFGPSLSEQTVGYTEEGTATVPLAGTWFASGFQGAMGELLCAIEDGREPTHSGATIWRVWRSALPHSRVRTLVNRACRGPCGRYGK